MKFLLFLFCALLISCNRDVYFFSSEETKTAQSNIINRDSINLFKKQEVKRKRPKKKLAYQQPAQEEYLIVLDGQVEFLQPALPPPRIEPLDLPLKEEPLLEVGTPERKNTPPLAQEESDTRFVSRINIPKPELFKFEENNQDTLNLVQEKPKEVINAPSIQSAPAPDVSFIPLQTELKAPAPEQVFIPRALDILFVMDTSLSMRHHLIQFKQKFAGFLDYFARLDWQFALTNADHGDTFFLHDIVALNGKIMSLEKAGEELDLKYLNFKTSDYERIFLDSISTHKVGEYSVIGTTGDWEDVGQCELPPYCQGPKEQPLKSLKSALVKNQGFFRKEADLAVVVISNSKERSGESSFATKPEEVIEQFRSIHGEEKRFEVYGIIIPEGDTACVNQNREEQFLFEEADFSQHIADLSALTGGQVFSICLSHYNTLAQRIFNSFGTPQTE